MKYEEVLVDDPFNHPYVGMNASIGINRLVCIAWSNECSSWLQPDWNTKYTNHHNVWKKSGFYNNVKQHNPEFIIPE